MNQPSTRTILRFLFLPIFLFSGCAASPTLNVYGSYFPAWIVCIVVGIFFTVIARLLLVGGGIDEHLRFKPVVYCCMTLFITMAVWLIFFKG
jgi:hypothetical protein